jgi:hypothetical protein
VELLILVVMVQMELLIQMLLLLEQYLLVVLVELKVETLVQVHQVEYNLFTGNI